MRVLWNLVFPDDPSWNEPHRIIANKLRKQRELFLVGLMDARVIATVIGGYDGFRGWIYHLAVHPEFRNHGFGRRMMERIESLIAAQGAVKINLQIRSSNLNVIRFYERLGYRAEDHQSMGKRF